VSRRVQVRTMLVHTSQRVRGGGSIPALADPSRRLCNWPSIPSPRRRPFAWRNAEGDAKHWNVRPTHALLLQPEAWQTTGHGSPTVWSHRHPYIGALQTSVYLERQFSRIFPAHPRSLASVLIPRPAALRVSASAYAALRVSAFRKSLCNERKKIFRTFRKRRRLALGAGHTPTPPHTNRVLGTPGSRVASRKSVPRVIRANTNKEKNHGNLHQHRHSEGLPG
jgi:hypothetical protein